VLRLGSLFLVVSLLLLVGCGTRGLQSTSSTTVPAAVPATSSAQPPSSTGDISGGNTVAVSAGADTSGINITVSPSAGSENAESLGKVSDGFAANTGVIVHRASTETIVLFGTGLSGDMSVTLSGPNDIGMSNTHSVQAKDGTPGIAFDVVIGSTSAMGARTVYLKAANNDVTAFTGGLEVTQ